MFLEKLVFLEVLKLPKVCCLPKNIDGKLESPVNNNTIILHTSRFWRSASFLKSENNKEMFTYRIKICSKRVPKIITYLLKSRASKDTPSPRDSI